MNKYIIGGLIAIVCGIVVYMWHQNRKSNHDPRGTEVSELKKNYQIATFAGGCFWCTESDFEKVQGVKAVVSGYVGGDTESPSYKEVSGGTTGHREAIEVFYDADVVTYEQLLDVFWTHIDPTDAGGQFVDRGLQYSSAIFYHDDIQKQIAQNSKRDIEKSGKFKKPIETIIVPASEFFIAEDYHQDYHTKNPRVYKHYRKASGRDDYIKEKWGAVADEVIMGNVCVTNVCKNAPKKRVFKKPTDEELKSQLTDIQYKVTQKEGTEKPFDNEYWDNHEEGIYVDIISGEPLFSSKDKFDSGTGWPSFLKPIENDVVTEHDDYKLLAKRIEIRSKQADSHLGHVIMDGPESNNKVRYCMNSASLKFIPKEDLEGTQYEKYLKIFK